MIREDGPSGVAYYEYNPLNQQTKVVKSNQDVQVNRYDPEGLRAEMQENGKLVRFLFHKDEILVETNEENKPVSRFVCGYGVESLEQDGYTYYYHKDEQLSTSFITSSDDEIQNVYDYDAFGVLREGQESIDNRITYTGQQYDGISGQYYLRARYYNPVLGRFMQEDVYRGDGLNLYAYCDNNPVLYYDPSGYAGGLLDCGEEKNKNGVENPVTDTDSPVNLDTYENMRKDPTATGQAHHLSQDAAFRDVIPKKDGLSIDLQGNAFTEVGSQHYNAHNSLEGFWNTYRSGGDSYGERPTVGEYNRAVYDSLQSAGISKSASAYSVQQAYNQQQSYGLNNTDLVPRIPGRINQKK